MRRQICAATAAAQLAHEASLPTDYLLITKHGKPYSKESFKLLWANVRQKLCLGPQEITFHAIRARAASDSHSLGGPGVASP
ncbi:MAG: hypothetical protein KA795_06950 [Burkholderiaceae bacterium]|nr:hypothetical protein [Burkholderiaceae bacterium]